MGAVSQSSIQAWHGPEGQLAIGKRDNETLKTYLFSVSLPCLLIFFWKQDIKTFVIAVGSAFFVARLSTIVGTKTLVDEAQRLGLAIFVSGAVGLWIIAQFIEDKFYSIYVICSLAFAWSAIFYFKPSRLIAWQSKRQVAAPVPRVSIEGLRALSAHLASASPALRSLAVFDKADAALSTAWGSKDPATVSELLALGDQATQKSWQQAYALLNEAIRAVDAGRAHVRELLPRAEAALAAFKIDYALIDTGRSEEAYGFSSFSIPKQLDFRNMDLRLLGLFDSKSRIAANFTENSKPLQIAWKAFSYTTGGPLISRYYKSKWLRQLKDVEGELASKAEAVRGDCVMIGSLLETKLVPHLSGLIATIETLEAGIDELASGTADRDKALRIALVYLQGKKLTETRAIT